MDTLYLEDCSYKLKLNLVEVDLHNPIMIKHNDHLRRIL